MYIAIEDKVYYCYPDETGERKLFLTVHPDNGSNISIEDQANTIAYILNNNISTQY